MRLGIPVVILCGLLSGCQGASTVTPLDGQTNMPGSAQSDSLTLQLDAPNQSAVGTPVRLKLTLRNTTTQPIQVMLGGRPPYDFVVTTHDGIETWRWSKDQAIQAILEMRTLKPDELIEYEAEWSAKQNDGSPAPPGRYLMRAVLNMDPPEKLITTPRELVLTSR
jgi:hypothetical protein